MNDDFNFSLWFIFRLVTFRFQRTFSIFCWCRFEWCCKVTCESCHKTQVLKTIDKLSLISLLHFFCINLCILFPSQTEITCTSLPPSSSYRTSTGSWLFSSTRSSSVSSSSSWLLPASTSYQAKVDNSWYLLFKGSISFNPQLPCDMYCNLPGCPLLCWYEISSEGK